MGSQRVGQDWETSLSCCHMEVKQIIQKMMTQIAKIGNQWWTLLLTKRYWKNYKKIPWKILKIRQLQQNVQILGKPKIINSKTNSSRKKKAE